jgi:site-specific DNA-methyltransferase (adenine-specific)
MNLNTDNSRFSGGNIAQGGNGRGTANGEKITGDDKPFDPSFMLQYAAEKIIWGWNHFADNLPNGACLVWIKRNDQSFGSFLSDAEIAWKSKGVGVFCKKDLSNNSITRNRVHPTQKPLSLMQWCLSHFPKAETVLDPFMGSGTTLLAAKMEGRKAVGIEINKKYCEAAVKRLSQGVLFK